MGSCVDIAPSKHTAPHEALAKGFAMGLRTSLRRVWTTLGNRRSSQSRSVVRGSSFRRPTPTPALLQQITSTASIWNECELLLCCPAIFAQAKELFPKAVVQAVDEKDLQWEVPVPIKTLGIISPYLWQRLVTSDAAMRWLTLGCRQTVWVIALAEDRSCPAFRSSLHRAGFYEIRTLERVGDQEKLDYSTVCVWPSGEYCTIASRPGYLRAEERFCILSASRTAMVDAAALPWRFAEGFGQITDRQLIETRLGVAAMFIHDAAERPRLVAGGAVRTSLHWKASGAEGAWAELIGSYEGPLDWNLLAARVEPLEGGHARVSLMRRNPGPEVLASAEFLATTTKVGTEFYHDANVVLAFNETHVHASVNDARLVVAEERSLRRTSAYGLRLHGSTIFAATPIADPFREVAT